MTPRGEGETPTSERNRLWKLRKQGLLPPPPTCKTCGKVLKPGSSTLSKAAQMGLCWSCWKATPEGKLERRRQNLKKKIWGVAWWGGQPNQDLQQYQSLRLAIGASYVGRNAENGTVFVVWSDGRVTEHAGLAINRSKGLQPEDGTPVTEDPDWFRDQVDERLKTWFTVDR